MPNESSSLKRSSFPAPAIMKQSSEPKSLDLESVDMTRDGVQGDAVVSKGRASTVVTNGA